MLGLYKDALTAALCGETKGERQQGGRGEVTQLTVVKDRFVLRKFRRGGIMRFLGDRYLRNRAKAEFDLTRKLFEAGLPAPEPAGVAWRRSGIFLRGLLITRWLEGQDLDQFLRASADEAILGQVGSLMRRIHDAGVYHADLQVKNVRLTPQGPVLLDFDNARLHARPLPPLLRARNLLRFARSLEKNGLSRHYFVSILAGYGPVQIPRWLQFTYTIKGRLSDALSGRRTSA